MPTKSTESQEDILKVIKNHTKENLITSDILETEFNLRGEKVRNAIRELRRGGEPICIINSGRGLIEKSGYYYCLKDAIKTINNLESRSFSMLKTAKAMREKCGLLNEPTLII